jgi:hypothetical protein
MTRDQHIAKAEEYLAKCEEPDLAAANLWELYCQLAQLHLALAGLKDKY